MQAPKGIQQTRVRMNRAHLVCDTGYALMDPQTRKPLMSLSTSLFSPGHGYVVLQLFSGYDVLYRVWLSDELLNSEVTIDKLAKSFIGKLAMETGLAVRLINVDSNVDVVADEDEENVVVLWLANTCLGEVCVDESISPPDFEYYTELQGSAIRIQLADIFRRAIKASEMEDDVE